MPCHYSCIGTLKRILKKILWIAISGSPENKNSYQFIIENIFLIFLRVWRLSNLSVLYSRDVKYFQYIFKNTYWDIIMILERITRFHKMYDAIMFSPSVPWLKMGKRAPFNVWRCICNNIMKINCEIIQIIFVIWYLKYARSCIYTYVYL